MIASHFAEPLERRITAPTTLRSGPADDSEALGELGRGDPFALLDNSRGWAWGYAGAERRVGYVRSEAVAA